MTLFYFLHTKDYHVIIMEFFFLHTLETDVKIALDTTYFTKKCEF